MANQNAEAEVHAAQLKEKSAREQMRGIQINSWPHDAEGNPMAIVIGAASDLVPTVQFGNVCVGPATIMRPVTNDSMEDVIASAREVQKAAEYIVGTERRILQWALDPASKVTHPVTGAEFKGDDVAAQAASSEPVGAKPSSTGDSPPPAS